MKKNRTPKSISLLLFSITLGLLSLTIYAAELVPEIIEMTEMTEMTEGDLDNVSAEAGLNLLNIFGAPAAGLTDDAPFDGGGLEGDKEVENNFQVSPRNQLDTEEDNTRKTAESELIDIESDQLHVEVLINTPILSLDEVDNSLKAAEVTFSQASALAGRDPDDTTTSQLHYQNKNYHHELEILGPNEIISTRDVVVDLLTLENLRGDHFSDPTSYGSIYISDFRSQGSTHTRVHD